MNAKLVSRSLASIASVMLIAGAAAQAAPTSAELEEVNFAQSLKEAGFTYPSIEEAVKARKKAMASAEADKAAMAVASAKSTASK